MRILHLLEPADGGVPRYVLDLSRGLVARGHSVDAALSEESPWLAGELRQLGAGVTALPWRPELLSPRRDLRSARVLSRLLAAKRWDVVHTHGNKAGTIGRPLARRHGLPVVHSPHGFAYLSQRQRQRRGMELRRALTLGIERALAPCSSVILCASSDDRDNAVRDRVAKPDRLVVVHNGADPVPAEPDEALLELRGEGPLVGFLARLHEQKDPLAFVAAIAALAKRGVTVKAALVGDGPLAGQVRARVAAEGLDAQVAVLPYGGSAGPALAAFDVYVLPSRWEVFGISLLEAMAASLPVVATAVGGIPEVVEHERTGLLVPLGDTTALAGAIERLVGDEGLRRRLGEGGRERWQACFRTAAMVDGVEAAYERAISR